MKQAIFITAVLAIIGCNTTAPKPDLLQTKVDSLSKQLEQVYKPGLGEFMLGVQVHHTKIFFAGQAQNWELAQFEWDELQESLEDIRKFNSDRPELKSLNMINAALDSVGEAIKQKNTRFFQRTYTVLTNTCNQCHMATGHGFNVIKIPDANPFSDQVFESRK